MLNIFIKTVGSYKDVCRKRAKKLFKKRDLILTQGNIDKRLTAHKKYVWTQRKKIVELKANEEKHKNEKN